MSQTPLNFGKRDNVLAAMRWVSLALILFMALVFVTGQVVGLSGLDAALRKLSPGVLTGVLLAVLAANLLRFARWSYFAEVQHIHVPPRKLALYYTAGMALLPTPGKLGTALRLWLLNTHHKIPYARSLPLMVLDLLTDTLAVVVMVALALPWFGQAAAARLGVIILALVLAGVVAVFYYPAVSQGAIKLARRASGDMATSFFDKLSELATNLQTLVGLRNLALTTGLSLAAWLLLTLAFAGLLHTLGYGHSAAGVWPLAAFAIGGGMALGALSMLPGGLGSTEATMMAILLAGNVSLADATIFIALTRLCTLWLPVGAGLLALPFALKK